jgi:2,3-bisphosphoglycerate-independent phosphoglycerate mutase
MSRKRHAIENMDAVIVASAKQDHTSAERMALSHATPVASMRHSSHESDALQAQTGTQTAHQHALRGGIEFA